ncbi:MAG: hypothetical protein IJI98_00590 [Methanosphaera sp.]|jgi:hypothetical protein|nr:hypothetical protein [Methanosphaera sp.]
MANNKQKIANKVFKVLPMYEEGYDCYYKYLTRIIIELQGEDPTEPLTNAIIALKGLKAVGKDVEHDEVRRIIMRHTSKLSDKEISE